METKNVKPKINVQEVIDVMSTDQASKLTIAQTMKNLKAGLLKIFYALLSLAAQGAVIMLLWNYVFPTHNQNYFESLSMLVMVRIMLGSFAQGK